MDEIRLMWGAASPSRTPQRPLETQGAGEEGTHITDDASNGNAMHLEVSRLSNRMRFLIPFLVLLLLKLFLDNLLPCILIVVIGYSLQRVKKALDMQLSLKDRSSRHVLFVLLVFSIVLLLTMVTIIELLDYTDGLFARMIMEYPASDKSKGIFNVIWCCLLTDAVVRAFQSVVKLFVLFLTAPSGSRGGRANVSVCKTLTSMFGIPGHMLRGVLLDAQRGTVFVWPPPTETVAADSGMRDGLTSDISNDDRSMQDLEGGEAGTTTSTESYHRNNSSSNSGGGGAASSLPYGEHDQRQEQQSPVPSTSPLTLFDFTQVAFNSMTGLARRHLSSSSNSNSANSANGIGINTNTTTGSTGSMGMSSAAAGVTAETSGTESLPIATLINNSSNANGNRNANFHRIEDHIVDSSNASNSHNSNSSSSGGVGGSTIGGSMMMDDGGKDSDIVHVEDDARLLASSYLYRLRVCTLVDICSLLYRTMLPVPLWIHYFSTGGFGSLALTVVYTAGKLLDLTWKARGASQAVKFFMQNKIEFGQYSTAGELASAGERRECPICFDSPVRPVTLDCNHLFCEMCIAEWLDKEHTCPVCRAEVSCKSKLLGAVKAEATQALPIVI